MKCVEGHPPRTIGAIIEIHDEKAMIEKLRQSAERMELSEKVAGFGVYELDSTGERLICSPGWAALVGLPEGTTSVDKLETI